ncbi:integration host factor subunit beta [candidate division KSB1 bacterium]|nr:integration host factor subunit beta [candidate division KSB1 bacterium]
MTKADIISIISEGTGLTKVETAAVVDGFIAALSFSLNQGETVELRGFGTFKVVERKARKGRNPKTGEIVYIPRRKVPVFRYSKDFRDYINKKTEIETPDEIELDIKDLDFLEGGE